MGFEKVIWIIINTWLKQYPILLILFGILFITIWKGIPYIYRWIKNIDKHDTEERIKFRKKLDDMAKAIGIDDDDNENGIVGNINSLQSSQNTALAELRRINGSFKTHCANSAIHVHVDDLVTTKEHRQLIDQIDQGFKMLGERINGLK